MTKSGLNFSEFKGLVTPGSGVIMGDFSRLKV
jgi:hypothetical protein